VRRGPRLYFSFRSPYTWMTVERLLERVPDAHERIDFVPYWDPDPQTEQALHERSAGFHYQQMSKAKHLYILHDTKRLAATLGLPMRWPVDLAPWWELPHLAWLRARDLGRGAQFYRAVTDARWLRGADICAPDTIRAAAAEAGLDGEELVAAPHDPTLRQAGVDCLVAAYEDDVFGIPYFRLGRHRFWGYDRLDAFLELFLPTVGREQPAPPAPDGVPGPVLARVGSYDRDTPGGCG
jgi:2-hydroxychromene-2-carboxylate isomerase